MHTKTKCEWAVMATAALMMLGAASVAPAQQFNPLVNFDLTNGSVPQASLVQGVDGSLYGTTWGGGANAGGGYNGGTVFKMTPTGTLTTLYSFCAQPNCADGQAPLGALVRATDGSFYGTTMEGGDFTHCAAVGCGTVFKITPAGALTTLYEFCSQAGCPDGQFPNGLIQASDGNFYGSTSGGGVYGNYGTVFKISRTGALTTLHSFCAQSNCPDGFDPEGALVQATNGDFYGTTESGGAVDYGGTVFKITSTGTLTTLHTFCAKIHCPDGNGPFGALVQATDSNFYGTTYEGGTNEQGTVFKITPTGKLTTLYSFCALANCDDGEEPMAGLVQATDGNFYGTTYFGGTGVCFSSCGTVFEITPTGELTTLVNFDGTDGRHPDAAVTQDTSGAFYGTTYEGGTSDSCFGGGAGCGTVFTLSVGLGPFVETLPSSGKVGAAVKILGTDLTGATSVTFNGTPATFKVVSASEITTTVPSGATSGTVQVTLPSETLSSSVPFRVSP